MTKYIFVTGGVVSGLGKGITAASLGRLLKARGLKVAAQKLDPYINVDPGTMSPYQHGEVYVTEDGAEHPLPADEQFAKETVLDVNAFWDAFNTPWINQFTGTAHRLYAAKLFDGVRYPLGMLHEDYYVLPDLIARCTKILCLPFTGYYVLRHAGSITDGAKHEVRLAMTKGDIHRAEYFLQNGWYDRAEGALTDAALFLYKNKRGYDLTRPGHKAEFAAVKRELCRVYSALAAQKGAASLKLRAAALRMGLPVFYAYTKMLSRR